MTLVAARENAAILVARESKPVCIVRSDIADQRPGGDYWLLWQEDVDVLIEAGGLAAEDVVETVGG